MTLKYSFFPVRQTLKYKSFTRTCQNIRLFFFQFFFFFTSTDSLADIDITASDKNLNCVRCEQIVNMHIFKCLLQDNLKNFRVANITAADKGEGRRETLLQTIITQDLQMTYCIATEEKHYYRP